MKLNLAESVCVTLDMYKYPPKYHHICLEYNKAKVPFAITVIFKRQYSLVFKKQKHTDEDTNCIMEKIIILI